MAAAGRAHRDAGRRRLLEGAERAQGAAAPARLAQRAVAARERLHRGRLRHPAHPRRRAGAVGEVVLPREIAAAARAERGQPVEALGERARAAAVLAWCGCAWRPGRRRRSRSRGPSSRAAAAAGRGRGSTGRSRGRRRARAPAGRRASARATRSARWRAGRGRSGAAGRRSARGRRQRADRADDVGQLRLAHAGELASVALAFVQSRRRLVSSAGEIRPVSRATRSDASTVGRAPRARDLGAQPRLLARLLAPAAASKAPVFGGRAVQRRAGRRRARRRRRAPGPSASPPQPASARSGERERRGGASCPSDRRPARVASVCPIRRVQAHPKVGDRGYASATRGEGELAMQGLMPSYPLTLTHVFRRAERLFPEKGIATVTATGIERQDLRRVGRAHAPAGGRARRARRSPPTAASAPSPGTPARHLELYFAAPCSGRVLHTLNIRLFPDDIVYIANHAEDEVVFVDRSLLGVFWPLVDRLETVKHVVVMDDGADDEVPDDPRVHDYEALLAEGRAGRVRDDRRREPAPPPCVTRAARPATRRASSTRTARPCCTRWARWSPTPPRSASATR